MFAELVARSIPASTIQPSKALSREDALSERLKSLRAQPESQSPTITTPSQTGALPQPHTAADTDIGTPHQAPGYLNSPGSKHVDSVLDTDDQTLEELLAELGTDDQWLEEVAAEFEGDEEHRRVMALLEEIDNASSDEQTSKGVALGTHVRKPGNGDIDDEDDESDGEGMKHEVNNVLDEALDEADWEKSNAPPIDETRAFGPAAAAAGNLAGDRAASQSASAAHEPTPPRGLDSDPFDLPTVPSSLQDQPDAPDSSSQQDVDFAADIASRMAALQGLGNSERALPSAPTTQVDDLGLPVVPSFAPGDRPIKGIIKKHGYTDEDQKTWCIVCLEDGTIRCFGCDDDVYCARCWKEMHVGPRAGYDERGHKWETYVRGR